MDDLIEGRGLIAPWISTSKPATAFMCFKHCGLSRFSVPSLRLNFEVTRKPAQGYPFELYVISVSCFTFRAILDVSCMTIACDLSFEISQGAAD